MPTTTSKNSDVTFIESSATQTLYEHFDGIDLEAGVHLGPLTVAYETYGKLAPGKDNVVLILHALSGDAHAAGVTENGRVGWWDQMIGPGRGIDTDKYFVICSNCLGGCKGTTGPPSINPSTEKPFGRAFPRITISDMVNIQAMLMERLGVSRLHSVVGGSMGGMQALDWACRFPEKVKSAVVIAATARLSPQGIAFNWVGRNAIYSDPASACGAPEVNSDSVRMGRGLAVARMIGHITYLSEEIMERKFGRKLTLKDMDGIRYSLGENETNGGEFEVESYLQHQGAKFMERFDEDSYITITKAIDYFDLEGQYGDLISAFEAVQSKMLVLSFTSDWLYPTSMSLAIVRALQALKKDVSFVELDMPYGHDSFLIPAAMPKLTRIMRGFLKGVEQSG